MLGDPLLDPATPSDLPGFLNVLGQGNIRFAGESSDRSTVWSSNPTFTKPSWATKVLTPAMLVPVASLATATGWSVDLGVNLLHPSAPRAADEIQHAASAFGTSLHTVEIGNEPEIYDLIYGYPLSFPSYVNELDSYVSAIDAVDPAARIGGADNYLDGWLADLRAASSSGINQFKDFNFHFYPYADCNGLNIPSGTLLSASSFAAEARIISETRAVAAARGWVLRFDELNSISCGNSSPVVHTYASALWAVHALLQAARGGVAMVNVEVNPHDCTTYTPICVPDPINHPGTIQRMPISYAMQLVSALRGGVFLHSSITSGTQLTGRQSAYALHLLDGRSAVVVDNSSSAAMTNFSIATALPQKVVEIRTMEGDGTAVQLQGTTTSLIDDLTPTSSLTSGLTIPAYTTTVFYLSPA